MFVDGYIQDVVLEMILVYAEQDGIFDARFVGVGTDDLADNDIVEFVGDGVQIEFQRLPPNTAECIGFHFSI